MIRDPEVAFTEERQAKLNRAVAHSGGLMFLVVAKAAIAGSGRVMFKSNGLHLRRYRRVGEP